jgi:polyribonucleotide nucleotidyltransferase
VEVKKSQHKYIIGPKGNNINEILVETGVFVEMPQMDNVSETITLRGPQEKLGIGTLTCFFLICLWRII